MEFQEVVTEAVTLSTQTVDNLLIIMLMKSETNALTSDFYQLPIF